MLLVALLCGAASVAWAQDGPQSWDFGAQPVEGTTQMLTTTIMNGWWSAADGSEKVEEKISFGADTYNFHLDNPSSTGIRIRTDKMALTRYDVGVKKDAAGVSYSIMYVNGQSADICVRQTYKADDVIDYYLCSNGGEETYVIDGPNGYTTNLKYTLTGKVQKLTWYAPANGEYKLHGNGDEKMVVARIVRTPATKKAVALTINKPSSFPETGKVVFTQRESGSVTEVANNATTVDLVAGRTYDVTLSGADDYVVKTGAVAKIEANTTSLSIEIEAVTKVTLSGSITGLDDVIGKLEFTITKPSDKIFQPKATINAAAKTYSVELESGVEYNVEAVGVNDYSTTTTKFGSITAATTLDLTFTAKPVHTVTLTANPTVVDLAAAKITFANAKEQGYSYEYTGTSGIKLRDGVYRVTVSGVTGYNQLLTSAFEVKGADVAKTVDFAAPVTAQTNTYRAKLEVGTDKEFHTINEALQHVASMGTRTAEQRVTIAIDPGNYEEMLHITSHYVTLENASATPSIALKDKGVGIDDNAVRITSYYGHGYEYASMDEGGWYDERTRDVNKANAELGLEPYTNKNKNNYWNATVVVEANDFVARNIIFENSFNQYVSAREVADLVTLGTENKGKRPTVVGNTDVQNRSYRERACALAFGKNKNADRALIENCRVVGRQDALFGGEGCRVVCIGGVLMGACDYIFGGFTLICYHTDLELLTTTDANDVAHITAPQQSEARGYLFYECNVKSAAPGVAMASTSSSIPGDFGRPWAANTGEAVFCKTNIGTDDKGASLIRPEGWNSGLSGTSPKCVEFASKEEAANADHSKRVAWAATKLSPDDENKLADGTIISLFNFSKGADNWDPLNAKADADKVVTVSKALEADEWRPATSALARPQAASEADIVSVAYRTLDGATVARPIRGIYVETTIYKGGSATSRLVMRK